MSHHVDTMKILVVEIRIEGTIQMEKSSLLLMLFVFLPAIGAGLIQTTTGFGGGIFVMLFFPLFIPLLQSSALSTIITLLLSLTLTWKYRRHVDLKIVALPLVFYVVVSGITINFSTKVNVSGLKAYFGLFLIAVAIYFIFFANRIKLKPTFGTAAVCSSISGMASGLFGIGGPPMVLYFLAAADDDKMKYLATIQIFFFVTGLYNTVLRAINGILTIDILPLIIPGMIGIWIGQTIGTKIIDKINIDQLKKIIYIFLAASGFLTFVTNI